MSGQVFWKVFDFEEPSVRLRWYIGKYGCLIKVIKSVKIGEIMVYGGWICDLLGVRGGFVVGVYLFRSSKNNNLWYWW